MRDAADECRKLDELGLAACATQPESSTEVTAARLQIVDGQRQKN